MSVGAEPSWRDKDMQSIDARMRIATRATEPELASGASDGTPIEPPPTLQRWHVWLIVAGFPAVYVVDLQKGQAFYMP